MSGDSQRYDDIRTAKSNSESINSNKRGFLNPGFREDPEHDVTANTSKSQTCSSFTEISRKENYEPRFVQGKPDEQYVELEENQNHVTENDKPDKYFIDQNHVVKSTDVDLESSSSACLGFPTSKVPQNGVRKSNGNSFDDEREYINVEVNRGSLDPSPQYDNADTLLDEDQEYEIPTISIPSQTCPGSPESAVGYEKMGCQASEVDEASYSVASELFPTSFSTKL